jgi:hypothetical protein
VIDLVPLSQLLSRRTSWFCGLTPGITAKTNIKIMRLPQLGCFSAITPRCQVGLLDGGSYQSMFVTDCSEALLLINALETIIRQLI